MVLGYFPLSAVFLVIIKSCLLVVTGEVPRLMPSVKSPVVIWQDVRNVSCCRIASVELS